MRKPLFAFLLLMAFASALLLAQTSTSTNTHFVALTPAERAQHRVQFLTKMLSLTAAQLQQATTIFTNAGTAEDTVHSGMKSAHESLHEAIKNNDAGAIDQWSNNIGGLMGQQVAIEAKAHAALYQILTPDQQTKLAQMPMHGGMHVGGPGMMGFTFMAEPPHPPE
jgi:Spy/CpxP family protein refolding chaperone